ncbi:MAG: proprotein convertase P-domain-containing protein [Limnohabitans sp.]
MPWSSGAALMLLVTTLLLGCGGGGGPDRSVTLQAVQCDSGNQWANTTSIAGARIPDNGTGSVTVSWNNQNCPLQSIATVTVDICLAHTRPADLAWTLTPPGGASAIPLSAPARWNETGTSCDAGQGRRQSIPLPASLPPGAPAQGLWTVQVSDRNPGDEGAWVQWRVQLAGYN